MNANFCGHVYRPNEDGSCSKALKICHTLYWMSNSVRLIPIFRGSYDRMSYEDDEGYDGVSRMTQCKTVFLMASWPKQVIVISMAHRQRLLSMVLPCPIGDIHRRLCTPSFQQSQ